MKAQADKGRQEREFSVGDWVYLKLQPHIQHSIHRRSNHKLSFRFFGPSLVLQRIGKVTYKLQPPASSHIHPVVHVSQLKKALPPGAEVPQDEHLHYLSMDLQAAPLQVRDIKLHRKGNSVIPQGLVLWESWPASWATWENLFLLSNWHSAAKV